MSIFLLALISIVLSVAAQFSLKAGVNSAHLKVVLAGPLSFAAIVEILTNQFVFFGFVLYGVGAIVWLGVLARWDVSKAYPMVGLGFGIAAVVGVLLGDQITAPRVIGVLLICAGVLLVGQS